MVFKKISVFIIVAFLYVFVLEGLGLGKDVVDIGLVVDGDITTDGELLARLRHGGQEQANQKDKGGAEFGEHLPVSLVGSERNHTMLTPMLALPAGPVNAARRLSRARRNPKISLIENELQPLLSSPLRPERRPMLD